jgi:hypothetical protein
MADATIVIAETNASVVVTSDTSATISVTETTADLTTSNVGVQGATGATGAQGIQGIQGIQGASGVVNVTAPITNSGTSSAATIGIDQTALAITPSQVTGTAVITTDARLSDQRTPVDNSVTSAKIVDGTIVNADINASAAIDPTKVSGTAVITTDSRLSDARTPTSHASSHASAGSDPITIAQSQVTSLTTDLAAKAITAGKLSQFASTTSAELAGVISNETGSGSLVFGTSPTLTTSVLGGATFSAFATTDNLTIGSTSAISGTNNVLSGGTQDGGTIIDNYSVKNILTDGVSATTTINVGTGNVDYFGGGFASKTINIGTGTVTIGSLDVNIGADGGTTDIFGTVSLPNLNVSSTELGRLDGVTSNIQTQFTDLRKVRAGSGTTTSGSNLTVTHGLGSTPAAVVATVRANTYSVSLNTNIFVGNIGGTTFTVFANTGASGAVAATFNWIASA